MVFQKKKGRQSGTSTTDYSNMDEDQKRQYHYEKLKEHREKEKNKTTTPSPSVSNSQSSSTSVSASSSCGRKKSKDGPMTPRTKKRRKTETQKIRRKTQKLSQLRSKLQYDNWSARQADNDMEDNASDLSDDGNELGDLNDSSEDDNETEDVTSDLGDDGDMNSSSENNSQIDDNLTDNGTTLSTASIYRYRTLLQGALTSISVDNLKMLLIFIRKVKFDFPLKKTFQNFSIDFGYLRQHQLRYRVDKLYDKLSRVGENQLKILIKYWLGILLQDSMIEVLLSDASIVIDDEYLSKDIIVLRVARKVANELVTSRKNVSKNVKQTGTDFVVRVAKACSLATTTFNDIEILSTATSCHRSFAKKVLEAIETDDIDSLYKRATKFNAIKATHWPEQIAKFVLNEDNSRAVPGKEQVSVRYGFRLPKYILLHSREEIAQAFKIAHPLCEFSTSTIKREFPQNAVTPTTRDLQRNTCPIHANPRRVIKAINNVLTKLKIEQRLPTSCRNLVFQTMCSSETVKADTPLTWNIACAKGTCKSCPNKLKITIPMKFKKNEVKYSQWQTEKRTVQKEVKGKIKSVEKTIFSLYTSKCTLGEAVDLLEGMCKGLRRHIYTAHVQWDAHDQARRNLDTNSIISIEDYQMNMEVQYSENPTSLAYSTNKMTVAMYPICVEYKDMDGNVSKGAITFLSEDKDHSHQQVQKFEGRMFEIVREKLNREIKNWIRYSDGCTGQFKSGYVVADLFESVTNFTIEQASFDFFESHEGKSASDSIGSIVKCAFIRGMFKSDHGVSGVDDIVSVIASEIKPNTKKFDFFVVETFGHFLKRTSTSRNYCKVSGIMELHSLKLSGDKVVLSELSCNDCTPDTLCVNCATLKCVKKIKIQYPKSIEYVTEEEQHEEQHEEIEAIEDEDDDGQSDASAESSDEVDEDFNSGDIVWAKHGRVWYPAQICSLVDLPENLRHRFQSGDKVIVKWVGEDNYSSINCNQIDVLGENLVDAARAARSKYIMEQYNIALGLRLSYE